MRRIAFATFVILSMLCAIPIALGDRVDRPSEEPRPAPEDCGGDRVSGVWRARHVIYDFTYITTLHIQRVPGDARAIRGRMQVIAFTGTGRPPPPCRPGQTAYRVTQPATGIVDGLRVDFRAHSYTMDRNICGGSTGYNPDHFTGTIDANAPIFRAVNNDGGVAQNAPVMFRRLRCR